MPVHIDLAGLRVELSSARDELEQWAHKLASDAKKDKHAHDLQMERQSGAKGGQPANVSLGAKPSAWVCLSRKHFLTRARVRPRTLRS